MENIRSIMLFLAPRVEPVPSMRRWSLCAVWKSVNEFHRRGSGLQWWCKECRHAWDARYYAATSDLRRLQRRGRGERLVARMRALKGNPCVDCGGRFHPAAMTFDHRPGTKKVNDLATLAISGCTGLFPGGAFEVRSRVRQLPCSPDVSAERTGARGCRDSGGPLDVRGLSGSIRLALPLARAPTRVDN